CCRPRAARAAPLIARLAPSLPEAVKTISSGVQFTTSATRSRAPCTACAARRPAECRLDGLPKSEVKNGSIAVSTSDRNGVVAARFIGTDAQVLTPQPISGREAIAAWLESHFPPSSIVEVSTYAANGQRITWMTRLSESSGALGSWAPRYQLSWDEAVVVKG